MSLQGGKGDRPHHAGIHASAAGPADSLVALASVLRVAMETRCRSPRRYLQAREHASSRWVPLGPQPEGGGGPRLGCGPRLNPASPQAWGLCPAIPSASTGRPWPRTSASTASSPTPWTRCARPARRLLFGLFEPPLRSGAGRGLFFRCHRRDDHIELNFFTSERDGCESLLRSIC